MLLSKPENRTGIDFRKLCVYYVKLDHARYFSYLEMVNIILRALRRAGIPLKFSQGFHPKPKISFDDPLPIGIESEQECFRVSVPDSVEPDTLIRRLNRQLPEGLRITACRDVSQANTCTSPEARTYRISLQGTEFNQQNLLSFVQSPDYAITLSNRNGTLKNINLKDMVKDISLLDSMHLLVTLSSRPGKTIRPEHVLRHVFELKEDQVKLARVLKLKK
jgi:radical SAM-linked protein